MVRTKQPRTAVAEKLAQLTPSFFIHFTKSSTATTSIDAVSAAHPKCWLSALNAG
ncbi:hypothetical protein ART_2396 [Arthrobacter sp. PAMC 25486]|nr:hypothetical protein ART_2396 [Arthrobacter sp. PAMC 25486]